MLIIGLFNHGLSPNALFTPPNINASSKLITYALGYNLITTRK